MLVNFPVAFWLAGSVCDALTLAGVAGARPIAWLAIGAGVAVALATMAAGLIDFAALAERLVPAALRHGADGGGGAALSRRNRQRAAGPAIGRASYRERVWQYELNSGVAAP